MKQYDLVLVKSPSDDLQKSIREERFLIPLGLISIATHLQNNGFKVAVLDGQHRTTEEIKSFLACQAATIVGIDFHFYSVKNFECLTQFAKQCGHTVVTGGQAATQLADQVLENNRNVDFLVRHDGEQPVLELLKGTPLSKIPNLSYRNGYRVIHNPLQEFSLENLAPPNLEIDGIRIQEYFEAGRKERNERVINMEMQRGCPYHCPFCARTEKKLRSKSIPNIVKELKNLKSRYGISYIFIYDDTFAINGPWLEKLYQEMQRKHVTGFSFWCFGDIRHLILSGRLELLKKIGVDRITIGIESGDPKVRALLGKTYSNENINAVAQKMAELKITMEPSIIIGLPNETEETYLLTYRLLKGLEQTCPVELGAVNQILPLPGAPYWMRMLEEKEFSERFGHQYILNDEELRSYFLQNKERLFCREN